MKPNIKKVIVAHPGKQHSFETAIAIKKSGMLFQYITTVYDQSNSPVMRALKLFLRGNDAKRAQNRKNSELDGYVTQFCEIGGLLLLLVLRLDRTKSRVFYNWLNQVIANRFGKKVAKYAVKNKVDAVICYDANASACFKYLKEKAPHIIRIMDNAAPNRYGLYLEYQGINRRYRVIDRQPSVFKNYLIDEKCSLPYKEEAFLADYHLVASSFSAKMLNNIGIPQNKIFILPYGFNHHTANKKNEVKSKIKFLFVGEMSAQKGIFDYISVAKKFHEYAEFHAAGGGMQNLDNNTRESINRNLVYHGHLLQEELFELYNQMDVFLFPSLGDGFGFVVLEALSFGLPVICSENSVGGDIISEKENGLLFEAGNVEELENKIQWMIENKNEIMRMSQNAFNSVTPYTWENYYSDAKRIMEIIVEKKG